MSIADADETHTGFHTMTSCDPSHMYKPHFMLIPSLSCPAKCRYCFGPHFGPFMDIQRITVALRFMESVVCETGQNKARITLHGGESLAAGHTVIETLLEGLQQRFGSEGYSVSLQSNLWLLDDRFCELLKKHKVDIGTSLDGPMGLNDTQRGEGYFRKTMAGIDLARSHGLDVSCIATFTSQSADRWREVFDFFIDNGLHFSDHHAIPSLDKSSGLELSPERYAALLCDMIDYYLINRKRIKIFSIDQLCQAVALGGGKVCTFRDCFGMFLALDPLGGIYPCQRLAGRPEYRLGSFDDNPSLSQLSDSAAARRFLSRETKVKDDCRECEHYAYCKGGCTYNAWASGGANAIDPYCGAYRTVFKYIRQRLDEEMSSQENIDALAEKGLAEDGHHLMRVGPMIELTRQHSHPYQTARTAKRIVAAVELARGDISTAAKRLCDMGICRTSESAEASLRGMDERMKSTPALNNLYLHLTFNCQLHCTHCYAHAGGGTAIVHREMGLDAIERLVQDALKCGFQKIVFTGGEPLLHLTRRKMLLMLSSMRRGKLPLRFALRSNLTMPLDEEDLALIASAFDQLIVSVDGGPEEHDMRRGTGSYAKLMVNLEAYAKRYNGKPGKYAELSFATVMRATDIRADAGRNVRSLAARLGIKRTRFRPILPIGRAQGWDEPPTSEALGSHLDPLDLIKSGFQPVRSCGLGQNLYVEPSGESFPCYAYHRPHAYLGNVIQNGLDSVIGDETFSRLRLHTVDTNIKCRSCSMRYLCGGACRAWGGEEAQNDLDVAPRECNGLRERAEGLYKEALDYLQCSYGSHIDISNR